MMKVYNMDVLKALKQMPDESVDMQVESFKYSNTFICGMSKYEYMAGIVDGEAYVGIKKSTYGIRIRKDMKNPTYSELIQIKMQNQEITELFKKTFGGLVYQEKKLYQSHNGFKTHKKMWVYYATNRIASKIAKKIFPYLIEKKEQINCLLELRKSKENPESYLRGGQIRKLPMKKEIIEFRESLYLKVKQLNSGLVSSGGEK